MCAAIAVAAPFGGRASAEKQNNDYSLSGSAAVTLSAADILGKVYETTVSDEERAVLSAYADLSLSYTAQVPADRVSAAFDGASLTLEAGDYSYEAVNGKTPLWKPLSASVGDKSAPFVGKTAHVGEIAREDGEYAEVTYGTEFILTAGEINAAANAAYDLGKAAYDEIAEQTAAYESALAAYEKQAREYADYLAACAKYEEDAAAYAEYKKAYAIWKEKYDVYADYLAALALYEAGVEAYESYLAAKERYAEDMAAYRQYLADYAEYEKKFEIYYGQYGPAMDKINRHLAAMQLLDTPMTDLNRTVRAAVTGSTVSSVLENKLTIVRVFGVPLSTVNRAEAATENLRKVFADYFALETDPERYLYYSLNYEFIAKNVGELFVALDSLYDNAKVKDAVRSEDREEQYIILVSQLCVAAHALNDGTIYGIDGKAVSEKSWRISGAENPAPRSAAEVLGGAYYEDKNDAAPIEGGYPAGAVEPVRPEKVEQPVAPEPVRMPTPPEKAEDAGPAPEEVKSPVAPEEVLKPEEPPQAYEPEENLKRLKELYETGVFVRREEKTQDCALSVTATARKKLYDADYVTVHFHDGEKTERVDVERGTYAAYYGKPPVKAESAQYFYRFECWQYADGVVADLAHAGAETAEREIHVYPRFKEILRTYTVVWRVDGAETEIVLGYGAEASEHAPAFPKKPDEGGYTFRFIGWDKPVAAVTGDAVYTAEFEKSRLLTWKFGKNTVCTPAYDGENAADYAPSAELPDAGNIYFEFLGWDGALGAVTGDAAYTARYDKHYLAPFSDGRGADVSVDEGGYVVDCTATYDEEFDFKQIFLRAEALACSVAVRARGGEAVFSYSSVAEMCRDKRFTVTFRVSRSAGGAYEFAVGAETGGYAAGVTFAASGYDATRTQLYAYENGAKTYVAHTYESGRVRFTAKAGLKYVLAAEYAVTLLPSKYVEISADMSDAAAGESVRVYAAEPPAGVRFDGIRVTAADGEEIAVENGMFVMPRAEVVVEAVCVPVVYTVSFVSDGRVVLSAEYRYGETLRVPEKLIKADDGEYTYAFIGWDKPVAETVTEDAVYTAVYKATPVVKPDPPLSRIDKLFIAGVTLICVLGAAGIAVAVVFIVKKAKKKKN